MSFEIRVIQDGKIIQDNYIDTKLFDTYRGADKLASGMNRELHPRICELLNSSNYFDIFGNSDENNKDSGLWIAVFKRG